MHSLLSTTTLMIAKVIVLCANSEPQLHFWQNEEEIGERSIHVRTNESIQLHMYREERR